MKILLFFAAAFFLILFYYFLESFRLTHIVRHVPLRIGVTGTRGKSSVTRLIAAILRESDFATVAKTTGSRSVLIHTDGKEEELFRFGSPNILEQKKMLSLVDSANAKAFVSEIMSVHAENQYVESSKILRINICVITNIRIDHVSEQGNTRSDVARVLSSSIPVQGTVICMEGEDLPEIRDIVRKRNAVLHVVSRRLGNDFQSVLSNLRYIEFEENLSLAVAVCRELGLDDTTIMQALCSTIPDIGALNIWRFWDDDFGRFCFFVNIFAANDPKSSRIAFDSALKKVGSCEKTIGILNLRKDRGERTLQWIHAFRDGLIENLEVLYIIGINTSVVSRRLRSVGFPCIALQGDEPETLIGRILSETSGNLCLVGFGNMEGLGIRIVDYCKKRGDHYGA